MASPTRQQLKETLREQSLIVNYRITDKETDLRGEGILYRLLVWTADGRQHPAVTRTLQYAADIASSRNGQQMSAESRRHRWKHKIKICPPPSKNSHDAGSSTQPFGFPLVSQRELSTIGPGLLRSVEVVVDLLGHTCIALNVRQQLLTVLSFLHEQVVPPHFLLLFPQSQCSRRCAWHLLSALYP